MSRIRTIKPEFMKHWDLYQAELEANKNNKGKYLNIRIAFAGLFTVADREGRFKWQPEQLKLDCLPHDAIDFVKVLDILSTLGAPPFIRQYEIGGRRYGVIDSFTRHQFINNKESQSYLPAPPKAAIFSRVVSRVKVVLKGKEGREGRKGRKEGKTAAAAPAASPLPAAPAGSRKKALSDPERVAQFLRNLILNNDPKARVPKITSKAFKAWINDARKLLDKDKRPVDEIVELLRWCQESDFWKGNILTIDRLRFKYTTVLLQMKGERGCRPNGRAQTCICCMVRTPRSGKVLCVECARCTVCDARPDRFYNLAPKGKPVRPICRRCYVASKKKIGKGRNPGPVAIKDLAGKVLGGQIQ